MRQANPNSIKELKESELAALGGILIQFTDFVPTLRRFPLIKYKHVSSLFDHIIYEASSSKPLTFSDQLRVGLAETNGDLPEALWRLFYTSRLHARWLDGTSVSDLPLFTNDEILDRIVLWQQSLAGCKSYRSDSPQDVGGDTYYAWTHALASVIFEVLPAKPSSKTRVSASIFRNGTSIIHNVVHRFNLQAVVNNHGIASRYGNAMGRLFCETLANARK